MADRYDPKLSVRPLSERKPATPAAADEDPLVELARIVSGRTTFDPGPAQRTKTVPVNASVSSDVALANDLELELLNDLQASFSSTFYAPPPAATASTAGPGRSEAGRATRKTSLTAACQASVCRRAPVWPRRLRHSRPPSSRETGRQTGPSSALGGCPPGQAGVAGASGSGKVRAIRCAGAGRARSARASIERRRGKA